jgi:A/G-specific adenine glycosylase
MHNQAIMEFGALQCTPTNPNCSRCPLIATCSAYHNKQVANLPIKIKKVKVTNRYFYYFIVLDNGNTFIHQRTGNDIWKGLFQFPLLESTNELTDMQIVESNYVEQLFSSLDYAIVQMSESIKHILTHRHIYTKFIIVEINGGMTNKQFDVYKRVELKQLSKFAWPRVIDRYFEKQKFDSIE